MSHAHAEVQVGARHGSIHAGAAACKQRSREACWEASRPYVSLNLKIWSMLLLLVCVLLPLDDTLSYVVVVSSQWSPPNRHLLPFSCCSMKLRLLLPLHGNGVLWIYSSGEDPISVKSCYYNLSARGRRGNSPSLERYFFQRWCWHGSAPVIP